MKAMCADKQRHEVWENIHHGRDQVYSMRRRCLEDRLVEGLPIGTAKEERVAYQQVHVWKSSEKFNISGLSLILFRRR